MTFPGPGELGRGLVVTAGADLAAGLAVARSWERVRVDRSLLTGGDGRLADIVEQLHRAWGGRRRVLLELDLPAEQLAQLRQPEVVERAVHLLGAEFTLLRERLQFLLWRNNYDARSGEPVWWWARKAAGLGATLGGASRRCAARRQRGVGGRRTAGGRWIRRTCWTGRSCTPNRSSWDDCGFSLARRGRLATAPCWLPTSGPPSSIQPGRCGWWHRRDRARPER